MIFTVGKFTEENNMLPENVLLEDKNITKYIHYQNQKIFSIPNYYFCDNKYLTSGGFDGPGHDKLVKDLQISSISSGY